MEECRWTSGKKSADSRALVTTAPARVGGVGQQQGDTCPQQAGKTALSSGAQA